MPERDPAAEERLRQVRENTDALAAQSDRLNGSADDDASEAASRVRAARENRDALEAQQRRTEATTSAEVRDKPIGK